MKKNIISLLAGVAILAGFSMVSVSAYAGTDAASDCETGAHVKLNIQTSANVICQYSSDYANIYGVATGHKSGNKIYVSSNAMGKVYYKDVTGGTTITSAYVIGPAKDAEGASSKPAGYTEVGD